MKRVLFLCTGNYYRSRFAEIFFNWHAKQRDLRWKAESRGLALIKSNPGPISCYTIARLKYHGIPIDAYQRLPLEVGHDDFDSADHVVAVKEPEHRPLIQSRFPSWLERIEFWDVHDLDCGDPDQALSQLECEVMRLTQRLANLTAAIQSRAR
jgi:protein-tyrosine phosphatase